MPDIDALATRLDEAVRTGTATPQISGEQALTLDEAYQVQAAGVRLREARGEKVVGAKLGLTSKAKAEQMGVKDVIIGVVTDVMEIADGGTVDISSGVHPRIEPEVAFRIDREVDPSAPDSDLRSAVVAVAPALELIDSRYENFKFDLADVVADNTSASGFVVGQWIPVTPDEDMPLTDRAVTMTIDGDEVATGTTTDILGDPWKAIADVQRMAAAYGQKLPAGSVILAGAATAAVALPAGATVVAEVEGLGSVTVTTKGERRG